MSVSPPDRPAVLDRFAVVFQDISGTNNETPKRQQLTDWLRSSALKLVPDPLLKLPLPHQNAGGIAGRQVRLGNRYPDIGANACFEQGAAQLRASMDSAEEI